MKLEDELKQAQFESERQKVLLNILVSADVLSAMTNGVLKPYGISKEQFNVLRILRGHLPKPITVQEIANRMISKSSNATRLVDKLKAKGLVERVVCDADRRKVDVRITQSGLDLLLVVDPLVREAGQGVVTRLTEDEAQLLNQLIEKLRG